ncbi:MAG: hypothetical protein ACRELB_05180 [Polyangiaceae bacterium]
MRRVAELLEAEHVEYALIGGYALALQGIVRLTEDVDILVEPTPENARRWVRALSKLPDGAAKELAGDEIDGICVVSLEGLLRMKEHGRLKDQADAEAIRQAVGAREK